MLSEFSDRICTFFAVDYEPQLGVQFATAADDMITKQTPIRIAYGSQTGGYSFQWPKERRHLSLEPQRIAWETLGLAPWKDDLASNIAKVKTALKTLDIETMKRIGFKIVAYLPLKMNHAELRKLMFGSFLAAEEEFTKVYGSNLDPLVHFEGDYKDKRFAPNITGMNEEQASQTFLRLPNLEKFRQDKYLDTFISDFHERIANDCFFFEIDLFKNDVQTREMIQFAKSALDEADVIADASVRRLRSQPIPDN